MAIKVPKGTYGRLAPRSGLAANYFIDIGAGVIDRDFRGNISVLIFNFSRHNFFIYAGDKIVQLIIEKIVTPNFKICRSLDDSERGDRGFGSTGR